MTSNDQKIDKFFRKERRKTIIVVASVVLVFVLVGIYVDPETLRSSLSPSDGIGLRW